MAHVYKAVGWNRQKRLYDAVLWGAIALYLALFVGLGLALHPDATAETLLIRALGTGAFLLLHLVLSIGPLCRLDDRFLPLLYNRRHLGVSMFLLALAHGLLALVQFHFLGTLNPLVSVLVSNGSWGSLGDFPFQVLGLAALAILFLMAATSHDFWLHQLTAPVWKALHMAVYFAYALVVLHVALGAMQARPSPPLVAAVGFGLVWVLGLHLVAGWRERAGDRNVTATAAGDGYVDVCSLDDIPDRRARIACLGGERVAIFKFDGRVAALSNVCQHQNGPLGEGRVIDGCVTCPWHGYQYRPEDGASPPPFTERVPTFPVRLVGDRVFVHPTPHPLGTRHEPVTFSPPDR
jgi:nitrite reductase/ring-hydroxylating ferredoxin subunit/DMSO/TMAO reductase YedYZ heme-binding membrane subunit